MISATYRSQRLRVRLGLLAILSLALALLPATVSGAPSGEIHSRTLSAGGVNVIVSVWVRNQYSGGLAVHYERAKGATYPLACLLLFRDSFLQ
jgi:uncharacterized protein (DUF58 family)